MLWIKFLHLPIKTKLLFMETCFLLGYSRVLILILPFKKIARFLGEENQETASSNDGIDVNKVRAISGAIKTMNKYTPWDSKCLTQAYAAKFMLNRRHQKSTVYLGVAKDEKNGMIAHAWLRCGTIYVTGGKGQENFSITGKFA